MYLLQYKYVKLMDLKNKVEIKVATIKNVPGTDISNDPAM